MISGRRFKKSLLQLSLTLWAGSYLAGADQSHVVLVSIDGFAAYHLENEKLELPNIRALASEGVWAESGETVFPSVTHPSHATIITGCFTPDPRCDRQHPAKPGDRPVF